MRRKGKDPCIPGQFLGSPLLENPGEETKKKKKQKNVSDTADTQEKELRAGEEAERA